MRPFQRLSVVCCLFLACMRSAWADDGAFIAGSFVLNDASTGAAVESNALAGQPYALYFGFTQCPDVCPTTMATFSAALHNLSGAAAKLRLYFVSVDVDRDTPAMLATYVASFGPNITALTGSPDDIADLASQYGVEFRKVALSGGEYTFEHTATIFLIDADGVVVNRLGYDVTPAEMSARIEKIFSR